MTHAAAQDDMPLPVRMHMFPTGQTKHEPFHTSHTLHKCIVPQSHSTDKIASDQSSKSAVPRPFNKGAVTWLSKGLRTELRVLAASTVNSITYHISSGLKSVFLGTCTPKRHKRRIAASGPALEHQRRPDHREPAAQFVTGTVVKEPRCLKHGHVRLTKASLL